MSTVRHTKIRGVTYNDPETCIDRQAIIKQFLDAGTELRAALEPDNPVNANAVAIWLDTEDGHSYHLGYLGDDLADEIAGYLQRDKHVDVVVSEVTGGVYGKPTRGVNLIITMDTPADRPRPDFKSTAKAILVVIVVLIVLVSLCIAISEVTGNGQAFVPHAAILALSLSDEKLRAAVRRLRDNVSRHLAGLNEDEPRLALEEAEAVLNRELARVRKVLGKAKAPSE